MISHAGELAVTARLTTRMRTLLAGSLAVLLTSLPAIAAPLPASTPGAITISAYQAMPVNQVSTGTAMREHASSPAADTSTSADSRGKPNGNPAAPPVKSEFSSLDTAVFVPSNVPVRARNTEQSDTEDKAPASMPLVALAWLFGIGVIGMGTVGRRRKEP